MRVVFIYPELSSYANWKGSLHFGIGWLSAVLKQAGHSTSLLHLTQRVDETTFVCALEHYLPADLIAFSSTTNDFGYTRQLAGWIKARSDVPIVCGGVHATVAPEDAISAPAIDMICIGEGEKPLRELCDALDNGGDFYHIRNLWVKRNGNVIRNAVRPLIEHLDSLPFPDRKVFHYDTLEEMEERRLTVLASRGCPYSCTYCCNHAIRQRYPNARAYVRFRSVANVINEIEDALDTYPAIERIVFHDDVLILDKEWFAAFASEYRRRIGLPFACNCRANLMSDAVAQRLKDGGCVRVSMGIESGNDHIRTEILSRKMSRDQIVTAFATCKRHGIRTYSFNMVGLPFEDMPAMLDTIKLNALVSPHEIQTSIFYPYPKTELHRLCLEHGFLGDQDTLDTYFEDTILTLHTVSRKQILFIRAYFPQLVRLYSALQKLPSCVRQPAILVTDRTISSPRFPNSLLLSLHRLSPRRMLRSRFLGIYRLLRPIYKRLQYRQ